MVTGGLSILLPAAMTCCIEHTRQEGRRTAACGAWMYWVDIGMGMRSDVVWVRHCLHVQVPPSAWDRPVHGVLGRGPMTIKP